MNTPVVDSRSHPKQMKTIHLFPLLILLLSLPGCADDDDTATPRATTFDYAFGSDAEGWMGDFADYPEGEEDFYELTFDYATLPTPLDTQEGALRQSGNNHSDDLFMYAYRPIEGLEPGATYEATFELRIATDVPSGSFGVGGSPGESVYVKAGLLSEAPVRTLNQLNEYRVNFDKGNQSAGGPDMIVLGNFANGTDQSEYTLKTLRNTEPFLATADADGKLWFVVGTDSGYESTTTIYYDAISVSLR